jgi:hypothetical protein
MNLAKIRKGQNATRTFFTAKDNELISERIGHLEQMIEKEPKSLS